MAQWVQNVLKFRNFYDQIDFSPELCLAITKVIIKLINPSRGSILTKHSMEDVASLRTP